MKRNPIHPQAQTMMTEGQVITLEALEQATRVLVQAADDLRERLGAHDLATVLEVEAERMLLVTETTAEDLLQGTPESDVWPSVEEQLGVIWQDYQQWASGQPSARGEESYGTKKRLARLLRHAFEFAGYGIPRRKVSDDALIAAARDAWEARSRQ
jgi:hypothetical protein